MADRAQTLVRTPRSLFVFYHLADSSHTLCPVHYLQTHAMHRLLLRHGNVGVSCYILEGETMSRYDAIIHMSPEDLAGFLSQLITDTERRLLDKLSLYGVEVDMAPCDHAARVASVLCYLLEEEHDS